MVHFEIFNGFILFKFCVKATEVQLEVQNKFNCKHSKQNIFQIVFIVRLSEYKRSSTKNQPIIVIIST